MCRTLNTLGHLSRKTGNMVTPDRDGLDMSRVRTEGLLVEGC